jgi:hypothetical protein
MVIGFERGQVVPEKGPEVDGGSRDLRETWMLLEYADRGNLDRALVQRKFVRQDGFLDLVRSQSSTLPKRPPSLSSWRSLCVAHLVTHTCPSLGSAMPSLKGSLLRPSAACTAHAHPCSCHGLLCFWCLWMNTLGRLGHQPTWMLWTRYGGCLELTSVS